MKELKIHLLIAVCAFTLLAMIAACNNQGGGFPIEPEEPTLKKVAGVLIFCNGKPVTLIDSTDVSGMVCAKMNQNSKVFEVEFLDKNGEIINEDYQQHKLEWNYDEQYATFESECDWGFFIFGKKTGKTAFQFSLVCGKCIAYSSPEIPLEIK